MLFSKNFLLSFGLAFAICGTCKAQHVTGTPATKLEGRWDLTVDVDGKSAPSWLEVSHSGLKTLVGRFVGTGGSARPVSKVNFDGNSFSFSIPPQWEPEDHDLQVQGTLANDELKGEMVFPNQKTYHFTGKRAPALNETGEVSWGKPVVLFDGKDMKEWHTNGENQWVVEDGILRSKKSGSNLITNKKFKDFKLHIEFRFPEESNSGVYLRGRYEVQVMDSKGQEPDKGLFSAVYGFITPTEMAAKAPGEWQSYDIELVGRMVTVTANGKVVICRQAIPGITGGALDSDEGEPGPIYLQGDHGAIDYRNIIITPAK